MIEYSKHVILKSSGIQSDVHKSSTIQNPNYIYMHTHPNRYSGIPVYVQSIGPYVFSYHHTCNMHVFVSVFVHLCLTLVKNILSGVHSVQIEDVGGAYLLPYCLYMPDHCHMIFGALEQAAKTASKQYWASMEELHYKQETIPANKTHGSRHRLMMVGGCHGGGSGFGGNNQQEVVITFVCFFGYIVWFVLDLVCVSNGHCLCLFG